MRRWLGSAMAGLLLLTGTVFAETAGRDVTFISTSDSHYVSVGTPHKDRNANDRKTVLAINAVTNLTWPASLGGGSIDAPRGVMLLGDVIDDGDVMFEGINKGEKQYEFFLADFGPLSKMQCGTDGLLKYPVFETWGNHDGPPVGEERHGFSFQAKFKERNAIRKQKGLIKNLSDNGLHYSWDWDDVHFVMLGIYPADVQNPKIRYNKVWHDPQGALTFLREDLAKNVGVSGRPVILMSHCGVDADWWHEEDKKAFYDVASRYNVVAYIYGHSGIGLREWAPTQSQRKLLCINDGQTENGFFVIQLQNDRMRYGYYGKQWKTDNEEDGKPKRIWEGHWVWRFTGTARLPPMKAP